MFLWVSSLKEGQYLTLFFFGISLILGELNGKVSQESSAETPSPTEVDESVQDVVNEQELKYWETINDNPGDFTSWTYLLQFVEREVCRIKTWTEIPSVTWRRTQEIVICIQDKIVFNNSILTQDLD